jgi:RNA polymerase sigma-70 factor (ECF subfamily)
MDIPPIHDLVSRAQKGNPEAVGKLYDIYCQVIYRYLYYRTGNPHAAEDLTSEVFLKMVQVLPRLNTSGLFFRGWLFQIAKNLSIDHYRKNHAHPDVQIADDIETREAPIERVVEDGIEQEQLLIALQSLNEEQRDVIIMRFIDDIPIAEVAQTLHKSEDAVKGLQRRALISLRLVLQQKEVTHGKSG